MDTLSNKNISDPEHGIGNPLESIPHEESIESIEETIELEIGQEIVFFNDNGDEIKGTVEAQTFDRNKIVVRINNRKIKLIEPSDIKLPDSNSLDSKDEAKTPHKHNDYFKEDIEKHNFNEDYSTGEEVYFYHKESKEILLAKVLYEKTDNKYILIRDGDDFKNTRKQKAISCESFFVHKDLAKIVVRTQNRNFEVNNLADIAKENNHECLDKILKFKKEKEKIEKEKQDEIEMKINQTQEQICVGKSTEEKIDDLFSNGFENNNYDPEKIYLDFKTIVKSRNDFQLFFDRSEKLLTNFKHSLLFEMTLDHEKKSLKQIRNRLDNMNNYTKKDMKHFLNQLAKLTWVDNFNKEFQSKFEDENLQGGLSATVLKKCTRLFNGPNFFSNYIEGEHDASKAIGYWKNNKNWLFNQVSLIKQARAVDFNKKKKREKEEKKEAKSIWQRGWTKVKGWFGR